MASSAGVAVVAGGGGIGVVVDCMRVSATIPVDCDGSAFEAAMNAATLVNDGTPTVIGVWPWQAQHRAASIVSTSHGRSVSGTCPCDTVACSRQPRSETNATTKTATIAPRSWLVSNPHRR